MNCVYNSINKYSTAIIKPVINKMPNTNFVFLFLFLCLVFLLLFIVNKYYNFVSLKNKLNINLLMEIITQY